MPTLKTLTDNPDRLRDTIETLIEEYGSGDVTLAMISAYEKMAERNRVQGFTKAGLNFAALGKALRTAYERVYLYAK